MASINKVGGGLTLTFAQKNDDVRTILVEEKKKGTVLTDYICEAIRFYIANKEKVNNNSINISELVRIEVERQLKNLSIPSPASEEKAIDLENTEYIDDSDCDED